MGTLKILVIILIILIAYSAFRRWYGGGSSSNENYSVPSEYQGTQGLDYIRSNYASELSQARSLCTSQFKGTWIDTSNEIGCHNMQGFSTTYCSIGTIQSLISTCNSIGGNPTCSSTQASCSV